jgi:phosphatidate cytidylyltransferase
LAESKELKRRILTGAILGIISIGCVWFGHIVLPLMLVIFMTFAANEFFRFFHRKDIYPHTLAVFLPAYTIPFLIFYRIPLLIPMAIMFSFIIILSVLRFPGSRQKAHFLTEVTAAVFAVIYISLLPSTLILLRHVGFELALVPLVLTWVYDIAAYFTGLHLGKHKLAPQISPKKTWEGTVGGIILLFPVTYFIGHAWISMFTIIDSVFITIGIGILATVGDLFESGMKREVGLKDASKVFPGHGGFLDRIDSLLLTIPFFYLYMLARS